MLQEGIDVLVILNALRALGGGGLTARKLPEARDLAHGLSSAHRALRHQVGELAALAARLDTLPAAEARRQLEQLHDMLEKELLPHEREEQETAYPILAKMLKEEDPTGPLIQTHHEIHRLIRCVALVSAGTRCGGCDRERCSDGDGDEQVEK